MSTILRLSDVTYDGDVLPTVVEVSGHQVHINRRHIPLWLRQVLVHVRDVLGESQVILSVALVTDQPQEVEPGEQGGRQLNVRLCGLLDVVAPVGRIGRC